MKLRRKGLLITGTTTVLLLAILFFMSGHLLLSGFARVEYENTERNISRVVDAFGEAVNNLSVKSADWAKWDDTYRFIRDGNHEYIESNLTDESLAELELDLMLFFNNAGELVFGREYDHENESGTTVADGDLQTVVRDPALLYHRSVESVTAGIAVFPRGMMNIVSRPVLTSSGQGPAVGTLIFGRFIDSSEVGRIGQITHLALTVHPFADTASLRDFTRVNSMISDNHPFYIIPHTADTIAGFSRLTDLHGSAAALVQIKVYRDIYRQGIRTRNYLVVALLLAGIIFGIVIAVLLQNTVLSRITKLSTGVNTIAAEGDHSARVTVDGSDEIAELGGSVNGMLAALQRVEAQVRSAHGAMRLIMDTVPSGLLSIDATCRINPEYSSSAAVILGTRDLAGRDFTEVIGLVHTRRRDADNLRDYVQLLLREALPESQMGPLNPLPEVSLSRNDGSFVWIRLRYVIIRREEDPADRLLIIMEDITGEKRLAERINESERENIQLKAIAEDPDIFREFIADTLAMFDRTKACRERLADIGTTPSCINDMFREVHTIKGAAATFGLQSIVDCAGELEDAVGILRNGGDISGDLLRTLDVLLLQLEDAIAGTVKTTSPLIGDDMVEPGDFNLRISGDRLTKELSAIGRSIGSMLGNSEAARQLHDELRSRLRSLREVTAKRGFAKALRLVPGLLKRSEKSITFTVEGAENLIDGELARRLNAPLMHLLRNAVDHGIEPPEERSTSGKSEQGSMRVSFNDGLSSLIVQVADDGRGLNPELIRCIAIEKRFISAEDALRMTHEAVLKLIFRPGFSTAGRVTEISGRGVGLDVVADVVERQLHGSVLINSIPGKGATFTLSVPIDNGSLMSTGPSDGA